jgi:biofilm protein TabA
MIVCDLEQALAQAPAHAGIRKALEFLQRVRGQEHADGRVDIEGDRVYALYQSYETVAGDDWTFEGHRRYIDVQYLAAGEETLGWASAGQAQVARPYDAQSDAWLGTVQPAARTPVRLSPGQLAIFWPSDAHAPKRAAGKPMAVRKIVVKVAVD